ncbi:MAG: glycosyltransferase [Melioribacteraceae bacterium]|nr:glycosyltransferase [Melioribacteraceae bacterium]MCF8262862.1 glycosyltransferase [Melioribacteraceae bacterium]MCF8430653.1 glycosyltransferase [Melioribacteraceae bacterium]
MQSVINNSELKKTKKRVMVFIDWYWPGYRAGGPITSCINLVEELISEYDFYFITRNVDYGDDKVYAKVKSDEWNFIKEGLWIYYASKNNLRMKSFSKIISEKEVDYYYINGIYSFYFSILPLFLLDKKLKKVIVAPRGMLAESAISIKKSKKRVFLFFAKKFKIYQSVIFHATNEVEHENVHKSLGDKCEIVLAPNIPSKLTSSQNTIIKRAGELKLVYIARIAPEKNLLYALESLLHLENSKIEFQIYGPIYNENYWLQCRKIIADLPQAIKVIYKGPISNEKVSEVLSDSHFLFFPTLGENFGHIIIESLTSAVPVIISDETPWQDLSELNAGWAIPLSERSEFVDVLKECVKMDEVEYSNMRKSAEVYSTIYLKRNDYKKYYQKLFP